MTMSSYPSEEIKARLGVDEVLSGYLRLQKQGANFRALCPFHREKTPSFYVSPARQIWHCFGCGEGGDIFKFVMKMEGVEFVEALRILAKRAGVELKSQDPRAAGERAQLITVCATATQFFRNNMEGQGGTEARAYLRARGLLEDTIASFGIGWAPEGWDHLYQYLAAKGVKPELMEKAGLAVTSDKSGRKKYFDRFRGRIMFPIADAHGDVIGFTGRYLKEKENEGKYVNSPQTPLYNKSTVLFAIDKAKAEMRKKDRAILVEGQMDAILMHQDGVENTVAVSGTAFTAEQLDLLKRFTKNLCILFDADPAGDMATQRSISLALARSFALSVASVPEGKDPADFVKEHPGKIAEEVEKAVSVMEYYFRFAFEKYNPKKVEDKKKIAALILAQIKKISNKVEAHHWLSELSLRLSTKMEYLEEEMRRFKEEQFLPEEPGNAVPIARKRTIEDKLLEHILALVAAQKEPDRIKTLCEALSGYEHVNRLASDSFFAGDAVSPDIRRMLDIFLKYGKMGRLADDILKDIDKSEEGVAGEILLMADIESYPDVEKELRFSAARVEKGLIAGELARLEQALKEAEAGKDPELSERLVRQVMELSTKKAALHA